MKRTKIICTIGPNSDSPEIMKELIEAGMDVARINFSHGTQEEHAAVIKNLRRVASELDKQIAILQDLSGPKIRIGRIAQEPITLLPGNNFTLTNRPIPGDEREVSITYPGLPKDVKVGDTIFLADGQFQLQVSNTTETDINCEVIVGGDLTASKGINIPSVSLSVPAVTEKDLRDLEFGIKHKVDWVAVSFVRDQMDILFIKRMLEINSADIPVIAKIEKHEAMDNIDEIIKVSDGIMVARGDLGVEIPINEVPLSQKSIIKKANAACLPVITATQMLESMINNPRPTRAEVTDIANAIFDGADAVMLSGETAIGKYPVQATLIMDKVAGSAEEGIDYSRRLAEHPIIMNDRDIPDAISHAACHVALNIGARAIICCTRSGQTARIVAKYRPHARIVVVSNNETVLRRLALIWGVLPLKIEEATNTDDMIAKAKRVALNSGIVKTGDVVVIVAGVPIDVPGTTNIIKADML